MLRAGRDVVLTPASSHHNPSPCLTHEQKGAEPWNKDLGATCSWKNGVMFFCYCAVDYCCYGMQLYVIQKGSANLVVLATGLALPLANLSFNLPIHFAGFSTPFEVTNLVGLVCALVGFVVYQKYGETRIKGAG